MVRPRHRRCGVALEAVLLNVKFWLQNHGFFGWMTWNSSQSEQKLNVSRKVTKIWCFRRKPESFSSGSTKTETTLLYRSFWRWFGSCHGPVRQSNQSSGSSFKLALVQSFLWIQMGPDSLDRPPVFACMPEVSSDERSQITQWSYIDGAGTVQISQARENTDLAWWFLIWWLTANCVRFLTSASFCGTNSKLWPKTNTETVCT